MNKLASTVIITLITLGSLANAAFGFDWGDTSHNYSYVSRYHFYDESVESRGIEVTDNGSLKLRFELPEELFEQTFMSVSLRMNISPTETPDFAGFSPDRLMNEVSDISLSYHGGNLRDALEFSSSSVSLNFGDWWYGSYLSVYLTNLEYYTYDFSTGESGVQLYNPSLTLGDLLDDDGLFTIIVAEPSQYLGWGSAIENGGLNATIGVQTIIPEPSSFGALAGLVVLGLAVTRRQKR